MNVGDYVRTKYGIAKIVGSEAQDLIINLDKAIMYDHRDYISSCTHDEIIKSSPNIIDLIEVGDYVNGNEVIGKLDYLLEFDGSGDGDYYLKEEEIKSIVTKEQFESMEYKL